MPETLLTGWGRTSPTRADVAEVRTSAELAAEMSSAGPRGLIVRGLGRSYNDAAQDGGGRVLRLAGDPGWALDPSTGVLSCSASSTLDDLITFVVPRGWFVPVTPGTRMVTVGGMLAADVHGKNHHRDGTIGAHVRSLDLVLPSGQLRTLTPEGPTSEQFWATIGGMGLTGAISSATLQLIPITSAQMVVDDHRARDLDDLMSALVDGDRHRYSVAWIDGTPRGSALGRGIVSTGEHAGADASTQADPLALRPTRLVRVPLTPPVNPLNRWTVAAFNEAWYRKTRTGTHVTGIREFFHPLDAIGDWNRLYGPRGFLQYQFVVPEAGAGLVERSLRALQAIGAASFLAVLKRFGPGNRSPLSFPAPGWTLALDIPAGVPGLGRVLDDLDEEVVAAGGRLYLAKDGRMRPDLLASMYPRLDDWRRVRDQMDPEHRMMSDLARRLDL